MRYCTWDELIFYELGCNEERLNKNIGTKKKNFSANNNVKIDGPIPCNLGNFQEN